MKIRTGHVSNSSSSSFCIYGVRLEEADIPDTEDTDTDDPGYVYIWGDGCYFLGRLISESDECGDVDEVFCDPLEIHEEVKKWIEKELKRLGCAKNIDDDDLEFGIHVGMMRC